MNHHPRPEASDRRSSGHRSARILIAPDSFGDTLTAVQAAEAIVDGWSRARPGDVLDLAPQSDGGPGFVSVLASRFGTVRTETVPGPLTEEVRAHWLLDDAHPDGPIAYIESAQACGLHLLGGPPSPETAVRAHTEGVGRLIGVALRAGARRIVIGLGGSASNDGGRGLVDALGGLDSARTALAGVDVVIASDVDNPLLGDRGAVAVFGLQKGADSETRAILETRMREWAQTLETSTGLDIASMSGAGAAGGTGAALSALGGRRVSGAAVIAEATGLAEAVRLADVVVTGEGRFDEQTLQGKVISALTTLVGEVAGSAGSGPRVVVLAGQVELSPEQASSAGIVAAHSLVEHSGSVTRAMTEASTVLTELAESVARRWSPGANNGSPVTGIGGEGVPLAVDMHEETPESSLRHD